MAFEVEKIGYELTPGGMYIPAASEHQRGMPQPDFFPGAFYERLGEINEYFQVIRDPETGLELEIGVSNVDMLGKNTILVPSTSASSLTTNPGNLVEEAASAAANPNAARVYIAYFQNGRSSKMPSADKRDLMRTGRFSEGIASANGVMPAKHVVAAIARALYATRVDGHPLVPNHISSNVEGGRLGLGIGIALDTNSIEDGLFNGIPGVSDNSNYGREMVKEDIRGRVAGHVAQDSKWSPNNSELVEEAKSRAPRIYKDLSTARIIRMQAPAQLQAIRTRSVFNNFNNLSDPDHHALLQDLAAFQRRQEASITLQFYDGSKIHNPDDCIELGRQVMNLIPPEQRSEQRRIVLLMRQGLLDQHTRVPEERWSAERWALGSIAYMFGRQSSTSLPGMPAIEGRQAS